MASPSLTDTPATVAEYLHRGRMYYSDKGDRERAAEDFQRALGLDPILRAKVEAMAK